MLGYLGEVVTMTNALSPFIVERGEGGGLAWLGREVEATNVTATLLIQMRQDAYLHLDEAILTTTSSPQPPSTPFHTEIDINLMSLPRHVQHSFPCGGC